MWIGVVILWMNWPVYDVKVKAEEESQQMEEIMESYLSELELTELEAGIQDILPSEKIRFREMVMKLVKGQIPFEPETILQILEDTLLSEIQRQKNLVTQILILVVTSSVFSNFVKVFQKNQISDIAFYFIYLLLFVLLMKGFQSLTVIAEETIDQILHFMKLLLPVYLVVASLASGSFTAAVFYEITLLFITAVQMLMMYIVLPGIGVYVLFHLLNHLGKETYLSKFGELIRSILSWILKTLLALVVGVQTIQVIDSGY